MKKLLLTLCTAAAVSLASAQTKPTFGIKAGVNIASLQASADNSSTTATSGNIAMFTAGAFLDAPIGSKGVSIQPGLFYSGKGGNSNDGESTGKFKFNYLQLPINVMYAAPVNKAGKFFFGGGPYVAYALNGKVQDQINGQTVSVDVSFGNDDDINFNRTEFGINLLVGFQFSNKLMLSLNSDLGLTNIIKGDFYGISMKNRVVGITAGYSF